MIDKINDLLMDLDTTISDHGIKADIIVSFNVSETRIKPMGNPTFRMMTKRRCPKCNNTIAEDTKIEWCTYIHCEYIAKKKG